MSFKEAARHTCTHLKMRPLPSSTLCRPAQPKNLHRPYKSMPMLVQVTKEEDIKKRSLRKIHKQKLSVWMRMIKVKMRSTS